MEIKEQILHLFENDAPFSFEDVAISVFQYQSSHNTVYKAYLNLIGVEPNNVTSLDQIPLAPISLFKKHKIQSGLWEPESRFLSSGTGTAGERSAHYIKDLKWYDNITKRIIQQEGIDIQKAHVLALLPSYLENGDSSLVHMVTHFSNLSNTSEPFYLYNHEDLFTRINTLLETGSRPVILFGVTFALIDFVSTYSINDPRLYICFTGGMKNKGREMTFDEVMESLKRSFPASRIFSEYGMTELQSQAYIDGTDYFKMPTTLQVKIKEVNDPRQDCRIGKTGVVGLIDLANVDTLSFILSDDLGRKIDEDHFEILGRMTDSDLRGCNLLYAPR